MCGTATGRERAGGANDGIQRALDVTDTVRRILDPVRGLVAGCDHRKPGADAVPVGDLRAYGRFDGYGRDARQSGESLCDAPSGWTEYVVDGVGFVALRGTADKFIETGNGREDGVGAEGNGPAGAEADVRAGNWTVFC